MPAMIRRPLGYYFYITGLCNLNCDYCWQREMPDRESENTKSRRNELSKDEWLKIINTVPRLAFVGLTGGEPMIHPGFQDIIQLLSGRNPYTINTNGFYLNDKILRDLIEYKASNLSISIDGFSDVHDYSRGKPGLFNHIVEQIKKLNELKEKTGAKKPSITIKTVLLDPIVDRLEEFYHFCDQTLKADCLNISIMKTTEHAQYDFRVYDNLKGVAAAGEPICHSYEKKQQIPDVLIDLLNLSKKHNCQVLYYPRVTGDAAIRHLFESEGKDGFTSCYVPWTLIVILSEGSVIPCLSVKLSNIRDLDYDVKRIDELKKYNDFLKWRSSMNHAEKSPAVCNMCCFSKVKKD